MSRVRALVDHVDHFQQRVIREAIRDAERGQNLRRAAEWEAAAPRPGDYTGQATREQLEEAYRRCRGIAAAYRARAEVSIAMDISCGEATS